jgi:hypothetical protein
MNYDSACLVERLVHILNLDCSHLTMIVLALWNAVCTYAHFQSGLFSSNYASLFYIDESSYMSCNVILRGESLSIKETSLEDH